MEQFDTLDYLKAGNELQRRSYNVLTTHTVFDKLAGFTPVLVGTIPIDIAIASSDLDIVCCWNVKEDFIETLKHGFSGYPGFTWCNTVINGEDTVIANFFADGFEIEIFGQHLPVKEQNGYRHMLIEYQILQEKGSAFRDKIIDLKSTGMKTEPAFAKLLHIEGDPYLGLLNYKK